MFRSKLNLVILVLLAVEFIWFFFNLIHLTIFQYMFFIQILPSFLLAILLGRLASQTKGLLSFLLLVLGAMLFAILLYKVMQVTPQDVIEQNTVQSSTALFQFNREITVGTYIGFFVQELLLSSFVLLICRLYQRLLLILKTA